MATGPPTAPHGGTTARFWPFWAIFGPRISLSARVATIPVNRRFRPGGVRPKKKLFPRKLQKSLPDSVVFFFLVLGPLRITTARFGHFWAIFGPRISPSARVAKIPVNRRFRPGGVRPKKKLYPRKLRKSIPDSVVTFFSGFGTPSDHHGLFLAFLGHFWPQNFSKCPGGQNTSKSPIPAGGGPTEKKVVPEKVAEKHPG